MEGSKKGEVGLSDELWLEVKEKGGGSDRIRGGSDGIVVRSDGIRGGSDGIRGGSDARRVK